MSVFEQTAARHGLTRETAARDAGLAAAIVRRKLTMLAGDGACRPVTESGNDPARSPAGCCRHPFQLSRSVPGPSAHADHRALVLPGS